MKEDEPVHSYTMLIPMGSVADRVLQAVDRYKQEIATHTSRASIIFKVDFRKAGMPVYVICSPSTHTGLNAEKWWRSNEGKQMVLMELVKMANLTLVERRHIVGSRNFVDSSLISLTIHHFTLN